MVEIASKKILLAGDLVLDSYTFGRVQRISPEAPVPVLQAERRENRPGMAGNTAKNLVALEQDVILLSRIGEDGADLQKSLTSEGIDTSHLVVQENYRTPVKERLIAGQQQIARVDTEDRIPLTSELEAWIIDALPELLIGVDLCAISDYGKGFLTPRLLKALISLCKERSIPTCIDPKGRHYDPYRGATLIKPNLAEAIHASGLRDDSSLDAIAEALLERTQVSSLMITRSEKGISTFTERGRGDFPVQASEVRDVTGAGDTVLAVVAAVLANGYTLEEAAVMANIAAGEAVRHIGCVAVDLSVFDGPVVVA